jgi:hypothetical protein
MAVCASHAGTAHRRTKFTKPVKERVLEALRAGVYRKDAAVFAAISPSSLDNYLALGVKAREAGVEDEFSEFLAAVERAEVGLKVLLIGRVVAASRDDPKLGLDLAARKWPMEFGRRDPKLIEHTGTVGVEALLGGRQPMNVSRRTRERIIELIEEEERNTINGSAAE